MPTQNDQLSILYEEIYQPNAWERGFKNNTHDLKPDALAYTSDNPKQYAAVKDGKGYEGTKEEILQQVAKFGLDENNVVYIQVKGYTMAKFHSYKTDYTPEEARKDYVKFLFDKLSDFGYHTYIERDWKHK